MTNYTLFQSFKVFLLIALWGIYIGYAGNSLLYGEATPAIQIPVMFFGLLYCYARLAPVKVTIRKGRNWPGLFGLCLALLKVGFFGERRIRVKFSSACATYKGNRSWNKLLGRTDGFLNGPRTGSVRIGWRNRPDHSGITLVWFAESDEDWFDGKPGEWYAEPLTECDANAYRSLPWGGSKASRLWQAGWPLPPYFGGREPAPEGMSLILY